MKKNQTVAIQNYRLVGSVGDKTIVSFEGQQEWGAWRAVGCGSAKRCKGDVRDPQLAVQLACIRAPLDAAKNMAAEGERHWPGYFQEWL